MYKDVDPLMDAPPDARMPPEARQRVGTLYQEHALGLVRLAKIMLGDQAAAEDIVQDAFLGLYRKWPVLTDQDRALGYLRASVLNGCRTAHRRRTRRDRALFLSPRPQDIVSAEESALIGEANREVIAALRALPARQREAVVLRYYLDLTEDQAAQAMSVSRGTVKSATSRGRAALVRMLKEDQ
jgi:RNA polymerase sigma-70 factor (sigma-E family)